MSRCVPAFFISCEAFLWLLVGGRCRRCLDAFLYLFASKKTCRCWKEKVPIRIDNHRSLLGDFIVFSFFLNGQTFRTPDFHTQAEPRYFLFAS